MLYIITRRADRGPLQPPRSFLFALEARRAPEQMANARSRNLSLTRAALYARSFVHREMTRGPPVLAPPAIKSVQSLIRYNRGTPFGLARSVCERAGKR